MMRFGPSLLAFLAGVAWLGVSAKLIPALESARPLSVAHSTALDGSCGTATMIARLHEVHEASGLAVSSRNPNVLWTHNDSGGPVLYAVGTDGTVRGRVRVTGARVEDWEGLAAGPCQEGECLYIGDIGDNRQQRSDITIYAVPEPEVGASEARPARAIHVTYPEGPQDAEALFTGPSGALFIVTKGERSPISIYRVPSTSGTSVARLERVATLSGPAQRNRRITDADSTPDGGWIALRTIDTLEVHRASSLLSGNVNDRIEVKLARIGEPQGEGVAVLADGTVYLAGEAGNGAGGGTLARLSCKLP